MKTVKNELLYHINCKNGLNPHPLLNHGETINTGGELNPFRNSYENSYLSYDMGEETARTYWRFTKEFVFEQTRLAMNSDLPSRWTGLWVTDEEHLPYWEHATNCDEYQIVKMELNGKLLEADAYWIESEPDALSEIRKRAAYYWQGAIFRPGKMEYLFEGEAKVIEIVKKVNKTVQDISK
ncbi:Protein of unknown function [Virgibacillus subterraneus]|uniref:DUF3841 domain-containing protein n=1 Tax=Virgibacillus subterraneus TaxID=621109 RepID=A0A1H9EFB3_9BACI|nr:DUF2441 domain-containing protein [Virgibacillus subterraneus]SEQ23943.1 Protein of unknown function [Virgibacillus subterraneus]